VKNTCLNYYCGRIFNIKKGASMQFTFNPQPLANYCQWAYYLKAFSAEECERIKLLFKDSVNSQTGNKENPQRNSRIRKSEVSWITYSQDVRWIYEKLSGFVFDCNNSRYGYQLSGFGEPLQLGRYIDGDHYAYHQDCGPNDFSIRKLSVVLQLSDPADYEGGALEFLGNEDEKVPNSQGDLILFPSFNPHRVTQVTSGERFSLVSWVSGSPFR
jgi:PKHD-type hydroxylase